MRRASEQPCDCWNPAGRIWNRSKAPNEHAEEQGRQCRGAEIFQISRICVGKERKRRIHTRTPPIPCQAKKKLKELTSRSQGRNARQVMENVKVYIRGWIGYFYVADMKRILQNWDEWLRRRMRMYIWKQWKKPRTKAQNLRKLGVPEWQAYQ
nr:group II intron maturase-specific domain-containing protein [Paenibacillus alvei]